MRAKRSVILKAALVLPALIMVMSFNACQSTTPPAPSAYSIATAAVPDFSGSFEYVSDAEASIGKIAGTLQPNDVLWIGAISENSLKKIPPLLFPARKARTTAEKAEFINARKQFQAEIAEWFTKVKAMKHPGSDVYSAMRAAVYELNRTAANKKVLLVYSDMADTVTRRGDLDLTGIEVRVLYVYPGNKGATAYANYGERVKATLAEAHPASLEVLFPVQAKSFQSDRFVAELRRRN
jgi:hypothetical protein